MAVYRRGKVWWYEFTLAGRRIRESAKTTVRSVARRIEDKRRHEIEAALMGVAEPERPRKIRTVADVTKAYRAAYGIDHEPNSVKWVKLCLAHVDRLLGPELVSDLRGDRLREYISVRQSEGVGNRTINMELECLSRAVGRPWGYLWPKVRRLKERKDAGRALAPDEKQRLLAEAVKSPSPVWRTVIPLALLTGMRAGEIASLTWGQVDLLNRTLTVGKSKTEAGTGRLIPVNDELLTVLKAHAQWFVGKFHETKPERYVFPFHGTDPTRHVASLKSSWFKIQERAGVKCRFHDMRHNVCTDMAEAGVPEGAMLSIMGHLSRSMLERYSHIRMSAKRDAVAALSTKPKARTGVPTESPTIGDSATVQ